MIATDSEYVMSGATGWARGWVRNGWKIRTGGEVKNRAVWGLLQGEVERWLDKGLDIMSWKIGRELNSIADLAAKKVDREEADQAEFMGVLGMGC